MDERLNPSPKSDAGHYVDVPVVQDEQTIEVAAGEVFDRVFLIGDRVAGQTSVAGMAIVPELPFNHIIAGASSKVNVVFLILPGSNVDLPIAVDIIGEEAEVNLSGLYLCGGEERVTIRTEIRHRVPSCTSNQRFNGLAAGKSRVNFYGKIVVAPEAQKTEAYQANHNIVLSDTAHAETKPQLEIYADDVKCSHGATVGQLNEEERFYMRSRGIQEDEAKVLQMISFIAPVLANVQDGRLRNTLAPVIEAAVRRL